VEMVAEHKVGKGEVGEMVPVAQVEVYTGVEYRVEEEWVEVGLDRGGAVVVAREVAEWEEEGTAVEVKEESSAAEEVLVACLLGKWAGEAEEEGWVVVEELEQVAEERDVAVMEAEVTEEGAWAEEAQVEEAMAEVAAAEGIMAEMAWAEAGAEEEVMGVGREEGMTGRAEGEWGEAV